MAQRTATLLTAALLCCATACSGDDTTLPTEPPVGTREPAPTAPPTPPTEAPPPASTSTPPTTTVPATTETPTTTSPTPSTTSPTTTEATATTDSTAPADDEAAVRAVIDGYYTTYRECLRDIPNCTPEMFEPYVAEMAMDFVINQVDLWHAPPPFSATSVERFTWRVDSVSIDGEEASVTVCEEDDVDFAEGGEPIDTLLNSFLIEWRLRLTEHNWVASEFKRLEIGTNGISVCD